MAWNKLTRLKVTVFVVVVLATASISLLIRSGIEVRKRVGVHMTQTKSKLDQVKPSYGMKTGDLSLRFEQIEGYMEHLWIPFTPWLTNKADADLTHIDTQLQNEYLKKGKIILSSILNNESKLTQLMNEYGGTGSTVSSEVRSYLATRSADIHTAKETTQRDAAALDRLMLISSELESHLDRFQSSILTQRRREFADLLATIMGDIDTFIPFFQKREGHQSQINRLTDARAQVVRIKELQPDIAGLRLLETQIKTELYPLLASAQSDRDAILQQEQEAYRRKLAELAKAQTFIPEAPVKEGKVIFVSLAAQRLYAYENGATLFSYPVPVTTGKSSYATVTGEFQIFQKSTDFTMRSPFPDEPYTLFVKYWMPFYSGYGLHDAPWRGSFGGQEFAQNGTHGCVNMREAEVAKLFEWAPVGTKVIVQ